MTEMTISRVVKLRKLSHEVTLASSEAQSIHIWYQMKDIDYLSIDTMCFVTGRMAYFLQNTRNHSKLGLFLES